MASIYLIGDSTCQYNDQSTAPQKGWGQAFSRYVKKEHKIVNLAKNGRSTKSFIDEGLFESCRKNITHGDYLFIEFGHNDEKEDPLRHTDPFSTYQENLLYFVNTARNAGATPVLLSSIYRRHFDKDGNLEENCHGDYPKAMEELARRENVLYIDMCEKTREFLISIGDEASRAYFMNFGPGLYKNYPEGKEDNTHLRYKGAYKVSSILAQELRKTPLKEILK